MALIWQDSPNGAQATTDFGVYMMDDPDSTGRVKVDFQMGEMKVFVCLKFSERDAKKAASDHHDWMTEMSFKD